MSKVTKNSIPVNIEYFLIINLTYCQIVIWSKGARFKGLTKKDDLGGPVLNLDGQVIGVSTAIDSTSGSGSGAGFASPASPAGSSSKWCRASSETPRYSTLPRQALNIRAPLNFDCAFRRVAL